jgi:hypothetical protein
MSDFDPIKALQEEITGLVSVSSSIAARSRVAEEAMSKAEQELNDVRKVLGYVQIELQRKRTVLAELIEQQSK